ncbi:MAG TPA: L,D-transpeptidase family protein [Actinomycetota bacterium]|nr:L,D-transpeptidase family protein [Actinomycetota bacterium]
MARGRHEARATRRRRWPLIVGLTSGVLVLALGGAGYAAYRYDRSMTDRILPGVRIEGVDVSGMTRDRAIAELRAHVAVELDRTITVEVGDRRFTVTPRQLGRRAGVRSAVDRAFDVSRELGWVERAWRRLRDEPVRRDIEVTLRGAPGVERFVRRVAKEIREEPVDAAIEMADDGGLRFRRDRPGVALGERRAARRLTDAIEGGAGSVRFATHPLRSEVTPQTLGATIVVDVGTNTLDLYDGFRVVRTWDVATAKPGWVTPVGEWSLYRKAEDPTWYNPALDSWGAGLPAVIPGGPGNPMGTRALYITAPGLIRIHGTSSPDSIGRYASHGCIRMHNEEIEQLYELVPVGTKVIIVGQRPSWAVEGDFPDTPDGSDTVA